MNWVAAGIAFLGAIALGVLFVGYILLGNFIQDRWGLGWALFYGYTAPVSLIGATLAGLICK